MVIKRCLLRLLTTNCLRKYTKIYERVKNLMNIKFDSELVYGDNDKYVKTKIETYGEKANNNFQCDIITKENASYKMFVTDNVRSCY